MPEIKFTKLFINGSFVDAVSGNNNNNKPTNLSVTINMEFFLDALIESVREDICNDRPAHRGGDNDGDGGRQRGRGFSSEGSKRSF